MLVSFASRHTRKCCLSVIVPDRIAGNERENFKGGEHFERMSRKVDLNKKADYSGLYKGPWGTEFGLVVPEKTCEEPIK